MGGGGGGGGGGGSNTQGHGLEKLLPLLLQKQNFFHLQKAPLLKGPHFIVVLASLLNGDNSKRKKIAPLVENYLFSE